MNDAIQFEIETTKDGHVHDTNPPAHHWCVQKRNTFEALDVEEASDADDSDFESSVVVIDSDGSDSETCGNISNEEVKYFHSFLFLPQLILN